MGNSPRVRANAARTAVLTQWVIENRGVLTQSPIHVDAVASRFERETGVGATRYNIKQVFGAMNVPLARKPRSTMRRSSDGRLDRLISEVALIHEQLRELGQVAGIKFHMSEGLKALKNRKPDPVEFATEEEEEDDTPRWGDE